MRDVTAIKDDYVNPNSTPSFNHPSVLCLPLPATYPGSSVSSRFEIDSYRLFDLWSVRMYDVRWSVTRLRSSLTDSAAIRRVSRES